MPLSSNVASFPQTSPSTDLLSEGSYHQPQLFSAQLTSAFQVDTLLSSGSNNIRNSLTALETDGVDRRLTMSLPTLRNLLVLLRLVFLWLIHAGSFCIHSVTHHSSAVSTVPGRSTVLRTMSMVLYNEHMLLVCIL